ncbi:LacI family transcriptional regulator [Lactobacillus colini]|uniref:LacI family transcriptional regulator n=1 Tax=Lactobacillus colini TaxID=1819254 RepID=A0ABS4MGK3_9LACO|nr:LacI family DNA-binding transcriptional regulator [Lactobacillus colini]MBP2058457.1 LacI family transcriptional regulator [Lactobacillus colini]
MTTIRDVAKLAGVSVATVSRILNNKNNVTEKTRQKVEQAIKQTNYSPNQVARNLYKKRSKMIGIIVPYLENSFYAEIIDGIQKILQPAGYTALISFGAESDNDKYKQFIQNFEQNNIDGIITSAFDISLDNTITVPLVMYDSANIDDNIVRIASDNISGGKSCVELLGNNTRHVLIQHMSLSLPTVRERIEATIKELNHRKINYTLMEVGNPRISDDAKKAISFSPNYDAIITVNDLYAAEILKIANERNISVPQDIQIVGYDNNPISSYTNPAISTVDQHPEEIGETAANRLLKLIRGDTSSMNSITPITKIKRQSTN